MQLGTLVLKYFHLPHQLCSSTVLPGRLHRPCPCPTGEVFSSAMRIAGIGSHRPSRAGREEAGFELRVPPTMLCVSHQAAPQKEWILLSPFIPQFVVNSLGGTNLNIVDIDLSKASVPTSLLGLLSLLSHLQFPKPGVHGPVPWLGHRDATYRYWCQASSWPSWKGGCGQLHAWLTLATGTIPIISLWPEFICLGVRGV